MSKNMPRKYRGSFTGGITMAENKQYITQVQDNGRVMISEDVIISIITQSLTDIEGYVGLSASPVADFIDKIGKKNWGKGLKVTIGDNDALTVIAM